MADFDKVIPPGKEGKIRVKISGQKLTTPGSFEKNFTVATNDPDNKRFVLALSGAVKKVFDFSVTMLSTVYVGEKAKMECTATNLLATPVKITNVRWSDDARAKGFNEKFSLKLKAIESGKKYLVTAVSKQALPAGNHSGHIILTTDYERMKEKSVYMSVLVREEVEIKPERIYCTEMILPASGERTFTYRFTVSASRGDSLKVLKAVSNRDDMTVNIVETERGKTWEGTISIRPKTIASQYLGSVKITTNYTGYRELPLDVVGMVTKADR